MAEFADILGRSLAGVAQGRQSDEDIRLRQEVEQRMAEAQQKLLEMQEYEFLRKKGLDEATARLARGALQRTQEGLPLSPYSNEALNMDRSLIKDYLAMQGDPAMLPALTGAMSPEDYAKALRIQSGLNLGAEGQSRERLGWGELALRQEDNDLRRELGLGELNLRIYEQYPDTQRILATLSPEEQAAVAKDPLNLIKLGSLGRSLPSYQAETARLAVVGQMHAAQLSAWASAARSGGAGEEIVKWLGGLSANAVEYSKIIADADADPKMRKWAMDNLLATNNLIQSGNRFFMEGMGIESGRTLAPPFPTSVPPEEGGKFWGWVREKFLGGGPTDPLAAAMDAMARGENPANIQLGGAPSAAPSAPPPSLAPPSAPSGRLPLTPPTAPPPPPTEPDMSIGEPATNFTLPSPPTPADALSSIPTSVKFGGALSAEFVPWVKSRIAPVFVQVATPAEVAKAQSIKDVTSQAEYVLSVVRASYLKKSER